MKTIELIQSGVLHGQRLTRGTVDAIVGETSALVVRVEGIGPDACWCDVLTTGADPLELAPGDAVLVWHPGREDQRPVLLGRIGPSRAESPAEAQAPDEIVLEARKSLTLRVGDGSITIREDGKILIKGKDVVSHAQRTNRVKGGAVAIN